MKRERGHAQFDKYLLQLQGIGTLGGEALDVKITMTVKDVFQVLLFVTVVANASAA